jgi:hypothetical protein
LRLRLGLSLNLRCLRLGLSLSLCLSLVLRLQVRLGLSLLASKLLPRILLHHDGDALAENVVGLVTWQRALRRRQEVREAREHRLDAHWHRAGHVGCGCVVSRGG